MKNFILLTTMILMATETPAMSSLFGRKKTDTPETVKTPLPTPTTPELPPSSSTDETETVVVPGGTDTTVKETVKTPEETIKIEVLPGQVKERTDYAVKSTLGYMADVGAVANCVIDNKDFIKEVAAHKQFDYTKDTSKQVAEKMAKFTPVVLTTYKKSLTKTIAYRNVGSNIVYFNTTMNPRKMKYMVNTAIHERLHVVGYGHGDNSSKGKGNSVPYGVGDIAEKYADRCNKTKTK